ncbi:MAG: SGNH/GDSL hydrolase family protein [Luteolibacter sp.]
MSSLTHAQESDFEALRKKSEENVDTAVAKTAKETWAKLAGRFAKRPEFAYVVDNSALPNVLLYGDSISIGYTQRVREQTKGKADIYRVFHNGGFSSKFIPMMTEMHDAMRDEQLEDPWDFEWDVIHFNVGLHDLTQMEADKETGKSEPRTSIEDYKKNIRDIVEYLKELAPDAKLIFATTTPVPEGAFGPRRLAGDSLKYNEAAMEVLSDYSEVIIDDLYTLTKENHSDWWSTPGNVHYNKSGSNAQGDEVARVILETLRKGNTE